MTISVIAIGNSKGIRLSKTLLEKYSIQDSVELILEKDCIVLKPSSTSRKGWDKAFQKMHDRKDDQLFINDMFDDENLDAWK
jgi:antitoxin MazE